MEVNQQLIFIDLGRNSKKVNDKIKKTSYINKK